MKKSVVLNFLIVLLVASLEIFAQPRFSNRLYMELGHPGAVGQLIFSPNGKLVASVDAVMEDGDGGGVGVFLWDRKTGAELYKLDETADSIAFTRDSTQLAIASENGVQILNVKNGAVRLLIEPKEAERLRSLAFSSDGRMLAVSGSLGTSIFSYPSGKIIRSLETIEDALGEIAFTGKDTMLVGTGPFSSFFLAFWTVKSGKFLSKRTFGLEERFRLSANGKYLAYVQDQSISVLETLSGKRVHTASIENPPNIFAVSNNGVFVATEDKLLNMITKRAREANLTDAASWIAFSTDGKYYAGGSYSGQVSIAEVNGDSSRQIAPTLDVEPVYNVACSPQSSLVLTSSRHFVHVWKFSELQENAPMWRFRKKDWNDRYEQRNGEPWFSISPDGTRFATGGEESTIIQIRDTFTGNVTEEADKSAPPDWVAINNGRCATRVGDLALSIKAISGQLEILTRGTRESLGSLVLLADGWVVATPDGRFDANRSLDDIKGLHWIVNDEILKPAPLEAFMRHYYEPNLLPRLLKCKNNATCDKEFKPLPPIAAINRVQPRAEKPNIFGCDGNEVLRTEEANKSFDLPSTGRPMLIALFFSLFFIVPCFPKTATLIVQTGHSRSVQSVAFSVTAIFAFALTVRPQVDLELVVETGHTGILSSIWLSPDGKSLLSESDDRLIFWDLGSGFQLQALERTRVNAISPDGKFVLTNPPGIWSVADGQNVLKMLPDERCYFGLDSRSVSCKNIIDGGVRVLNLRTGEGMLNYRPRQGRLVDYVILDKKRALAARELVTSDTTRGVLELIDRATGRVLTSFDGVTKWQASANGRLLIVEKDAQVRVLDLNSMAIRFRRDKVKDWQLSHREAFISLFGNNKRIEVVSMTTGKTAVTFGDSEGLFEVDYSPREKFAKRHTRDESAGTSPTELVDLASGKRVLGPVSTIFKISPDERFAVVFDTEKPEVRDIMRQRTVYSVEDSDEVEGFYGDGKAVVKGDGKLYSVDLETKQKVLLEEYPPTKLLFGGILVMAAILADRPPKPAAIKMQVADSFQRFERFFYDGRTNRVGYGNSDGQIGIWDAATNFRQHAFGKLGHSLSASFTEDGSAVQVDTSDAATFIWDYLKGGLRESPAESADAGTDQQTAPGDADEEEPGITANDSNDSFHDSKPGQFTLERSDSGEVLFDFPDVLYCMWTNDETRLACVRSEYPRKSTARLDVWDISTKQHVFSLPGILPHYDDPADMKTSGGFSRDGRKLAVKRPSVDGERIEIWSRDGKRLFISPSGSWDQLLDEDLRMLILCYADYALLYDTNNPSEGFNKLPAISEKYTYLSKLTTSKDGRLIFIEATSSRPGTRNLLTIINVTTKTVAHGNHAADINSFMFDPSQRNVITAGADGMMKIWSGENAKPLVSVVFLNDKDWVVATPDGRFDTNMPLDTIRGVRWRLPGRSEMLPIDVFMRQFYEPNLYQRVMTAEKLKPLPPIAEINRVQPRKSEIGIPNLQKQP